jgi:O-antigen ligase
VKKSDWKKINNHFYFTLFLLVLIIFIQSMLVGRWEDFKFIKRLFLIIIILVYSIPIKKNLAPMLSFILGSLILLFCSSINLVLFFWLSGKIDMTTGDQVASILLGDRPYISYAYVLSFCLCLYMSSIVGKTKFLFYGAALIFFIFIFIISARISLISLGLIILYYVFYTKNIKRVGLIIFILGVFSGLMFTFSDSLKKRFFISSNEYTLEQIVKFEPRYYIWNCSYSLLIENKAYLMGLGFDSLNKQLEACYSNSTDFMNKEQQDYFVRSKFNTHNQFLNFMLSTGILSLLLFIVFFISWFKMGYNNYYLSILVFVLFLFCLAENILSRQMGVELFALTLVFSNMISVSEKKKYG